MGSIGAIEEKLRVLENKRGEVLGLAKRIEEEIESLSMIRLIRRITLQTELRDVQNEISQLENSINELKNNRDFERIYEKYQSKITRPGHYSNEEYLLSVLEALKEIGEGTVSEIQRANDELAGCSTPKITSLLKVLMEDGIVERVENPKRVIFRLSKKH